MTTLMFITKDPTSQFQPFFVQQIICFRKYFHIFESNIRENTRKMIVYISDAGFHSQGDGILESLYIFKLQLFIFLLKKLLINNRKIEQITFLFSIFFRCHGIL